MKDRYFFASIFIAIAGLLLFEFLAGNSPSFRFLFGSPSAVAGSLFAGAQSGVFVRDFLVTGFEAASGFILGVVLGTAVGYALWYFPALAKVLHPYIFVASVIPIVVLAPMVIVWFGIGISMKIALAGFATFLVALTQAYDGAKSVQLEEYRFLTMLGASRSQWFQKIVFPAALDWVFNSLRLNITFALLGAIIGEFIVASEGLGHAMFLAGSLYDMPGVLAGVIGIVLLALLLQVVVRVIEKSRLRLVQWFSIAPLARSQQKAGVSR